MGWFFSNFHVCKTAEFSKADFEAYLTELFEKQGFVSVGTSEDADLSVSVFDIDRKWISVCSDGVDFYTKESVRDICEPISKRFNTDVLTVSCFDSDCLLLNLINHRDGVKACAKVGRYPEIKQRSTPAKWKGIVENIPKFKSVLSKDYVFAEEALEEISPMLELASKQGYFCTELILENEFAEGVNTFYFTVPDTVQKAEPPLLTMPTYDLMPCEIGKNSFISAVNKGGKSCGVAIAFSGNYVENEDIYFRDVQFEYFFDRHPRATIPLQLEKRQTQDGQWIYYAEIPQFQIPGKVKDGLPFRKALVEEFKRKFGIRFTPEGDSRKLLDITLHFIPLKNPNGQCTWCVWFPRGSKKAFIEKYNQTWSKRGSSSVKLLKFEDFDIDE
ncbi:MAG: hypothetical protein IJ017_06855 [Oscillospiraceae bacterium]|nr:hypothetical protein [Oscillospiraceae bacterium]